jgi:hypothetical protein
MPESEERTQSTINEVEEDESINKETLPVVEVESIPVVEVQQEEVPEETETIVAGQTITLEEKPTESTSEDIPLEIKNYPTEQIPKDSTKGEQLGLF